MKKSTIFALSILLLFAAASCSNKNISKPNMPALLRTFPFGHYSMQNKRFDASEARKITVKNINGNIDIKPSDSTVADVVSAVTVKALSKEKAKLYSGKIKIIAELRGNEIFIYAEYPDKPGLDYEAKIDYDITVPAGLDVAVENVNGENVIYPGAKSLRAKSTNGNITATGIDGGNVNAETVNGQLKIFGKISSSRLKTTNGNIELEIEGEAAGRHTTETVNGATDIILTPESSLDIDLNTVNGSIECGFPLDKKNKSKTSLSGLMNGGTKGGIKAKSTNGAITVKMKNRMQPPVDESDKS